ncbi:MAG: hypothetical protein UZ07_CHB004003214 [Chlorobi bacterium OLB7]|nr:MAG: hypothetical protein UZ07_CHB004003214 [Chlorobi bacterium OLB7]
MVINNAIPIINIVLFIYSTYNAHYYTTSLSYFRYSVEYRNTFRRQAVSQKGLVICWPCQTANCSLLPPSRYCTQGYG